jgi:hypothetical protein
MNRTLTAKELAEKMADGRTLFDFLVESNNEAIYTLFQVDWLYVGGGFKTLSEVAQKGAKPENIFKVLNTSQYIKGVSYTRVAGGINAAISKAIEEYLTMLFSFLERGTLTDDQVLTLLKSLSPHGTRLEHGIAAQGFEMVNQAYLKLLQRLHYQSKDVLGLLEGTDAAGLSYCSLLQRNSFALGQSRAQANALRIACLFDQLNSNQLTADEIKKHVADQSAILDHVMQLPPAEKKAALRKMLDAQAQLGQLMLVATERKPPSIKREHGLLFKALVAYSELATDDDADFTYGLAVQLDGLIKNRSTRSPVVLKALMTLLQKSFSRTRLDDARMKAILQLLIPEKQKSSDVSLRSLVFGAYSPDVTQHYLDLLTDLCRYGMKADYVLTLVATPMQTWTKLFSQPIWAHITDLIAYHASDAQKMARQLMNIVAGCFQDADATPQFHVRSLFDVNMLSIGKLSVSFSSNKFTSLLNETDFFEALKHAAPIQRAHRAAHQIQPAAANPLIASRPPVAAPQQPVFIAAPSRVQAPALYPSAVAAPAPVQAHTLYPPVASAPPTYDTARQPAQQPAPPPPSLAPLPAGWSYVPTYAQGQPQFVAAPMPSAQLPFSTAHMMMSLSVAPPPAPMPAPQVMAPQPEMNTLQQNFELLRLPPAPREPRLEMPEFPTVPHQARGRQREHGF